MLRLLILILVVLTISQNARAQTFWVPKSPLFEFLYNLKTPVSEISNTDYQPILPIQYYKLATKQKIIKNNNGLFVLIDGGGQVYKATNLKDDKIAFTKIDSTIYFGNSFHSYNFSYKDTLFNFGGYGYWRANGLLSYFKEGNEWNIIKINKEYHAVDIMHSYLPGNSKLYYVQTFVKEEFTSSNESGKPLVIELDLAKKENTVLGFLSKEIDFPATAFKINSTSLQGVLVAYKRDFFLLNFSKNTVHKLTNASFIDEFSINNHSFIKNTFEMDAKLYYTLEPAHTLHFKEISMNDFKLEPYPLYAPIRPRNQLLYILLGTMLFLSAATISFVRYKNRRNNHFLIKGDYLLNPVSQLNSKDNRLDFNSLELDLIHKMIAKSKNGNLFTVDEMNSGIGLGRKSMETQKKIRTEFINRINHKFKINFNQDVNLIDRVRSEEDRRYFHYSISAANAVIYNAGIAVK